MPCNCGSNNCPECMGGWTPPAEPKKGDAKWKDDKAASYCYERGYFSKNESVVVKLPMCEGYDLGYMAITYHGSGYDSFRTDFIRGMGKNETT